MKHLKYLLPLLLLAAPLAYSQNVAVNLWFTASSNSTAGNPGTTQIYRATGSCPTFPGSSWTELDSTANASYTSAAPYQDATVTDGQAYSYVVTATVPGYTGASGPSNCWSTVAQLSQAPSAPGGLTGTVVPLSGGAAPAVVSPTPLSTRRPAAPRFTQPR